MRRGAVSSKQEAPLLSSWFFLGLAPAAPAVPHLGFRWQRVPCGHPLGEAQPLTFLAHEAMVPYAAAEK